jgi:hypothetical protein
MSAYPVNDDDFSMARRAGSSARIARRCATLAAPQIAISSSVRPHPAQSSLALSMAQIFVQGESIFIRQA